MEMVSRGESVSLVWERKRQFRLRRDDAEEDIGNRISVLLTRQEGDQDGSDNLAPIRHCSCLNQGQNPRIFEFRRETP